MFIATMCIGDGTGKDGGKVRRVTLNSIPPLLFSNVHDSSFLFSILIFEVFR